MIFLENNDFSSELGKEMLRSIIRDAIKITGYVCTGTIIFSCSAKYTSLMLNKMYILYLAWHVDQFLINVGVNNELPFDRDDRLHKYAAFMSVALIPVIDGLYLCSVYNRCLGS